VGRHLVALLEDNELFSALLAPIVRSPAVSSPPKSQPTQRSQDPDTMEIVPSTRIKKRHASKSTLVVMEFCGIHLCMNFKFLT
jgi:hypothetical protein